MNQEFLGRDALPRSHAKETDLSLNAAKSMSDPTDIAVRTQRFRDAVRAFTPQPPTRYAKLMPLKDGIIELREKGASLRLIRELLATVDVAVGTDTIARFLAEVNGEQPPHRSSKRSRRRRAVVPVPTTATPITSLPAQPPSSKPMPTSNIDASTERPRTRGPRIADPHNL
jgi:hypothetical protein